MSENDECPHCGWTPAEFNDLHDRAEVARTLAFALRGLYDDQVSYLTLNKLGGMDNHWMRAARIALADYGKAAKL